MKITRLTILLFGLGILMQFNNCSPMAKQDGFSTTSILATCDPNNMVINGVNITNPIADATNVNCAVADQNNLSINPRGGDIAVAASVADFNIGGSCNEGGFVYNQITWTLKSEGVMVRNSGMIYNNQTWNGQCINGQFNLVVHLAYSSSTGPAEDPNNRTGLYLPSVGAQRAYTLDITIIGFDASGTAHINTIYGLRTINLNPIL